MPNELKVGNVTARPGETKWGPATSVELRDGTWVNLPVIVVNGAEDGPTLVLTAATHPTEVVGIEAVRIVTRELVDPKKLKGRVIAFPVANPLGFQFGTYTSPHDGLNMSVAYPGNAKGQLTSRLANFVWENAAKKADLCMDFHENVKSCLSFCIVGYPKNPETEKKALEAARAFGMTVIRPRPPGSGFDLPGRKATDLSYSQTLMANGIPAFTPEFEKSTDLAFDKDEIPIQVAVRGILNVMKYLKMIPGKIEEQTGLQVLHGNYLAQDMIKANRGGVVHRLAKAGVKLKKGTPIVKIYDLYGDVVETIEMPIDGYIWGWTVDQGSCQMGSNICFLFKDA